MSEPQTVEPHRTWALITGASSGIGAAYARALAGRGHAVALAARRLDRLADLSLELSERFGVPTEVLQVDLSQPEDIHALERWIAARPELRTLVHSAGFGTRDHFSEIPAERTLEMLRVHVEAGVRLTRAALPTLLAAQEGTVVLISSLAGFFTTARYVTYSATKAYLNQFAEGLAAEVGPAGVRVQALCPGLTRTEFLETPEYDDFKYDDIPDWAWMTAEQVVAESLSALARGHSGTLIPGWQNRVFVGLLQAPALGAALRWGLGRLSAANAY